MQKADLTYAHLEMNFGTPDELKWTPRGQAGVASYMNTDPSIAKDLADIGIDALSLAHNHSFDVGPGGHPGDRAARRRGRHPPMRGPART